MLKMNEVTGCGRPRISSSAFFYLSVFIFFLSIFINIPDASAASEVSSVSVDNNGNDYIASIAISDMAEYRVFTLKSPDRLVIDIDNSSWQADNGLSIKTGFVENVRHGVPEPGKLRIVMELTSPVEIKDKVFIFGKKGGKKNLLEIKFTGKAQTSAPKEKKKSSGKYEYNSGFPFSIPTFKPSSSGITKHDVIITEKPLFEFSYKPVIVIDAGHGGVDPGAIGKSGIFEKIITLQYAKALKNELEKTGRYKVFMTRSGDYYVGLDKRVELARKAGGELLISLHADSHPDSSTRGLSVYTLSERRSQWEVEKSTRKAAKTEIIRGVDLSDESGDVKQVLIDLAHRQAKNTAASFAELLVRELGQDAKLLDRAHRFAGLAVLTGLGVPSVLVELGYVSNRYEEKLLMTTNYRKKLVSGIRDALDKYFEQ